MIDTAQLQGMNADQLRALAMDLMSEVRARDSELRLKDTRIAQLTHEMAVLKRWKFAARSEKLPTEQQSLLDEAIDADLIAIEHELEQPASKPKNEPPPNKPRRAPLPPNLPRVEVRHEPTSTTCGCGCQLKRIGEDVGENLGYRPGVFTVERHVRGKWVCAQCETLMQAPVPAQVIDKGIPTAGLLAQVLVAKYSDHLPIYRQERIFERAGLAIPRSTLAQWVGMCGVQLQPLVDALKEQILQHRVLHADETPVAMLSPGKGKTQRAYLWTYCPGAFEDLRAVVLQETIGGIGTQRRLLQWAGAGALRSDRAASQRPLSAVWLESKQALSSAWLTVRRRLCSQVRAEVLPLFEGPRGTTAEVARSRATHGWRTHSFANGIISHRARISWSRP